MIVNLTSALFSEYVLGVCTIIAAIILVVWQRSKHNEFDLKTLLVNTETGRVELFKVGQLVSLIVSSWVLIHQTMSDRLTDWLFTGYMLAWAGANLVNKAIEVRKEAKNDST